MSTKDLRGFSLPRQKTRQSAVVVARSVIGSWAIEGRDFHVAFRMRPEGWSWRTGPKPDTSHLPPYEP